MSAPAKPLRLPLVRVEELLRARREQRVPFVDLRSPVEFEADHLPGAVNVPLFDDLERALIGTLYARRSPEAAFEEGRRRTRAKVHDLVERLARVAGRERPSGDLAACVDRLTEGGLDGLRGGLATAPVERVPEGALVLGCWRGGLRSQSVVALLRELGFAALGLEGGYKAYRAVVRREVDAWTPPPVFVLRGLTGVGKTLVLHALEALRPGWTLDLEGLAGHRSSILGMVGREPCTQRAFESRLRERLAAGFSGICVVEGESRKVGDVILPDSVWRAMAGGTSVELVAPTERRVDVLIDDYLEREENRVELARQLPFIEERLGPRKWGGVLVEWLGAGEERRLVEVLLERYYDPRYRRSEARYAYARTVDATDPAAAAHEIAGWVEARLALRSGRAAVARSAEVLARSRPGAAMSRPERPA